MHIEGIEVFIPKSPEHWRQWLIAHHKKETAVWVVFYNKASGKSVLSWSEAVDEALCFGWIDSKKVKLDAERSRQYFSVRKAKGMWSKINKDKVAALIEAEKMMPAGYASIEVAKQNGSWTFLDAVEDLQVPEDMQTMLQQNKGAEAYYESLSPSTRKFMLTWILMAKRAETREKRIREICEAAAKGEKPKMFR